MKNSKFNTLDVMHVQALNLKELVSTDGGMSIGTLTKDVVEGTFDAKGVRVPASFVTTKYDVNIDDKVMALFTSLLAHKGAASTAPVAATT